MSLLWTSLVPVMYSCCLFCYSALSTLPPNSSHLSSLLCFHFLSVLSLSRSSPLFHFIFSSALVFFVVIIHYLSVISHLSLVYLCLFASPPLLCYLICFCSFIFLSMFSFTPFLHCCLLSIFYPFLSSLISTSLVLSLCLLLASFSQVADLVFLLTFCFFLSSNFYGSYVIFFLNPPTPFYLFVHPLLSPLLTSFPSLSFLHPSIALFSLFGAS